MRGSKNILTWLFIGTGLVGVMLAFVLPSIMHDRGGSSVMVEAKLSDCTNSMITVRVKKLPKRISGVLFALPPTERTNQVVGLSGYYVVNTRPAMTNRFMISEASRWANIIPRRSDLEFGDDVYRPDEALASFWVGKESLQANLKPQRSYTFTFYFSNTPPADASLWLRWRQPPGRQYRLDE